MFRRVRNSAGNWGRITGWWVRRGGSWQDGNASGVSSWVRRGGLWVSIWGSTAVPTSPEEVELSIFFDGGNEFGTATATCRAIGAWVQTRAVIRRTDNGLPDEPDSPYLTSPWTANGAPGSIVSIGFGSVQRWIGTTRYRVSMQHRNATSLATSGAPFSSTQSTTR